MPPHRCSHPVRTTRPLLVAWMLLALAAVVRPVLGADVLIVTSAKTGPYAQATRACVETLTRDGHRVRSVGMGEVDSKSLRSRTDPVVAVGSGAAKLVNGLLPPHTRLVYCMTPTPDLLGLTERDETSGVSTDPDFARQIELIEHSGLSVSRVGMLYRSGQAGSRRLRDGLQGHLPEGWTLIAIDMDRGDSASSSIEQLCDSGVDLVWTAGDPAVYNATIIKTLLLRSIRNRVPVFGFSHAMVRSGAPLGVGFSPESQGVRAAGLVLLDEAGVHEPSGSVPAINATVLSRLRLTLSAEFMRRTRVRFGED